MQSNRRRVCLAELGRIVTGKTPPSSLEGSFGGRVPFITPSDYDGSKFIFRTARCLTSIGENAVRSARIPAGAVMVTCIGSDMGKVALSEREAFTNQQINSLIVEDGVTAEYVYYNLLMRKSELRAKASGSAQPILNKSAFGAVEIELPSIEEQGAIVSILRSLDSRINILRQTNATLESIAQALFKSWFIDFDPVRAKAEGREPEGMDADTAALFPDSFEDSALGRVPHGWNVRSLDSIANYLNGLAMQKYPPESDDEYLPVIKIAQLRAGNAAGADKASVNLKPEYIVRDGDVLFSWSGSLEVEFWCGGNGALNQHLFKVTSKEVPRWLYYLVTRHFLPGFREVAAHKATTMGHIQRKHLTEARLALPSANLIAKSGEVIGPLLDRRIANSLQIRELAAIRDTLLPRLISGKLRLLEAEAQLNEALA
ncbi:restriction endonuclease subunit S [Burkholderia cenocepacia]|nr:restriction endonuclease subunit S [Burkholderia cenocepacia]MBR7970229.1 restriction endonuclease subunit S [Burkholderia cenocepacia]